MLDAKSRYELDEVAMLLNKYSSMNVRLEGHTDNTGDADANLELSKNRASNVLDYLVSKGVSANRLSSVGFGQDRPIESNDTDEGRANNRRTELVIISK